MKNSWLIVFLFLAFESGAQDKHEKKLIERTYQLSRAVFGTKDSVELEKLFASELSYGHSKGKLEGRREAITGIAGNTSTYSDTAVSNIQITRKRNVAVVRHLFSAREHKIDGSTASLKFSIMLVWIKKKNHWKLMARQAIALPQ